MHVTLRNFLALQEELCLRISIDRAKAQGDYHRVYWSSYAQSDWLKKLEESLLQFNVDLEKFCREVTSRLSVTLRVVGDHLDYPFKENAIGWDVILRSVAECLPEK